jgi:cobalt-zinc-cadmium efflux system outer membrane protein
MHNRIVKILLLLSTTVILVPIAKAQNHGTRDLPPDTLRLTIDVADSIFLQRNLPLLASSMNIEAERAQIIQAKAYPNPVFTASFNAWDPDNRKAFHVGSGGEKLFQFDQLILLGGKRKSEIEIAKTNAKIAELEFAQLLRQLRFRLRSDLYALGETRQLLRRYDQQIELLQSFLNSYTKQAEKGNIPLKDLVRLKGAYLKLTNERSELYKEYLDKQNSLQTLLHTGATIEFKFGENDITGYIRLRSLDEINTEAMQHRPELQIVQTNKQLAEQYLQYQKRLAIPDLNLFTSYAQRSGAFNNEINAGFAIPLTLWNRNKGNIKSAQYRVQEADYSLQSMENEMMNEIRNAYMLYTQTVAEYQKAVSLYNKDFELTSRGINENFARGNVNLMEFIDFFEAYYDVLEQLSRLKIRLVNAAEQINLLTGKDIY